MKTLPLTVSFSVANYYRMDAQDFLQRFDTLWEQLLHKSGRIKSFVDLLMGCECALKSHVFLSQLDAVPEETYAAIRKASHSVRKLSELTTFMKDRTLYVAVADKLEPFGVFFRYSLDAFSTFFPDALELSEAKISYGATIGNNDWVLGIRADLDHLIQATHPEFSGTGNTDLKAILRLNAEMSAFVHKMAKR